MGVVRGSIVDVNFVDGSYKEKALVDRDAGDGELRKTGFERGDARIRDV